MEGIIRQKRQTRRNSWGQKSTIGKWDVYLVASVLYWQARIVTVVLSIESPRPVDVCLHINEKTTQFGWRRLLARCCCVHGPDDNEDEVSTWRWERRDYFVVSLSLLLPPCCCWRFDFEIWRYNRTPSHYQIRRPLVSGLTGILRSFHPNPFDNKEFYVREDFFGYELLYLEIFCFVLFCLRLTNFDLWVRLSGRNLWFFLAC